MTNRGKIVCDFENGKIYRHLKNGKILEVKGANNYGYLRVRVDGKEWLAHRYLYKKYYNVKLETQEFICHIDGNPLNNKITNLEKGTHKYNMQQQGKPKTNTTGEKNITWEKNGKYIVKIQQDRKTYHYGTYDSLKDAVARRDQVLKELNEQGHSFITDYSDNKDRLPVEYCEKWHKW